MNSVSLTLVPGFFSPVLSIDSIAPHHGTAHVSLSCRIEREREKGVAERNESEKGASQPRRPPNRSMMKRRVERRFLSIDPSSVLAQSTTRS